MIGVSKNSLSVRALGHLSVVAGVAIFSLGFTSVPAGAFKTNAASGMQNELKISKELSFDYPSPSVQVDSCLPLLKQARLSPEGSGLNQSRRSAVIKASMPVTLGFLMGVRSALGPKETIKTGYRVQIGPETIQQQDTGERYALAVASYRGCKDKQALQQ